MPCYDPPPTEEEIKREEANRNKKFGFHDTDKNTKGRLMQIACRALNRLTSLGYDVSVILDEDEYSWYLWHIENDKERIKKEALAKLTHEEKLILGL